jgi:hypothetical protein
MAACLLSGFVLLLTKVPVPAPKSGPAAKAGSADVSFGSAAGRDESAASPTPQAARPRLAEAYGKLPLSFEINRGQTDSQVKFLSRGSGYSLFLTGNEAVLALKKPGARSRKPVAPAFRPAHQGSADLGFRSAAFPGLLEFSAAETNSITADQRTESALQGLVPAALLPTSEQFKDSFAPRDESRVPSPEPPSPAVLRMKLVGANPHAKVSGLEELLGKSNYFIGNDPKKWRTNVPNYAKVKYASVYPAVDLVYYGNQGKLEYDFVVQPGADPESIQLAIVSDEQVGSQQKAVGSETDVGAVREPPRAHRYASLRVDTNGDLVVGTNGGEVIFHKPVIYQPGVVSAADSSPVTRSFVDGRYRLEGENHIRFELGPYDRRRPVVIDPVLAYSTYLGGSDFDGWALGMAVDASGNVYVAGVAQSLDFPTTPGAFQTTFGGGADDAFVSKLNTTGSALLYSTYLGGNSYDVGASIAVDTSGNAYVTGSTVSSDFPTTPGAFQTAVRGFGNAFVTKLNATGSALLYSTYLGGSGVLDAGDQGSSIAIDTVGNAYVTGYTLSFDFPTTSGAFQTRCGTYGDTAFVTKLNSTGSALVYSTCLSGNTSSQGDGIVLDALGNAYLIGWTACETGTCLFPITPGAFQTSFGGGFSDVFVTKMNTAGSGLLYSTYLGGTGDEQGNGVAIDASGNAYLTGVTSSSDFPTTPGALQTTYGGGDSDAFITKLNVAGSALVYSTYLGGSGADGGHGMTINASGNAYVEGWTGSSNFPTTTGALQASYGGGEFDAFIIRLNGAGSRLLYSTYLGGSGFDGLDSGAIALDASGNVYVAGETESSDFPITPGVFQTTLRGGGDAFVAKISPADARGLSLGPAELTFAPQATGTTSAPQRAVLLDGGSQPLGITRIVASGDFAQTNTCGSAVPAGRRCTITVTFKPTATGTRAGAITITDNAAGSPHKLPLTGVGGVVPVVTLTPADLNFYTQVVRTTSPAQPATLTNTGNGALSIISIATAGDFAQTNNCGSTVNAGASCTINVTFTPTATGTRSGTIRITDNASGSPQRLLLTGTGVAGPVVSLTPPSLIFAFQPVGSFSPAQRVTLRNIGVGAALEISNIGRSGDFYESNNCPTSLGSGASCTLWVIFTPTSPGTKSSSVTIVDNATGTPHQLPLSGTGSGTGSIILQLSSASLSFGSVPVGSTSSSQTVKLTNTGTVAASFLEPFGFATTGANWSDFHKNPHCGTSLAPGKSCTISVFFKPLGAGPRTGFFLVRQGAASQLIPLSGTGTP